jgi:hypothetical protein
VFINIFEGFILCNTSIDCEEYNNQKRLQKIYGELEHLFALVENVIYFSYRVRALRSEM